MPVINFKETAHYEQAIINGIPCLFNSLRIDRKTLPESLHAYDIRDSDDGGDFANIERNVWCNHAGTILTDREIPMTNGDWTPIEDYDFTDNDGSQKLLELIESL
jgi:hypothetical protein